MRRIFWGFCRNKFLIDPLNYLSSQSDFGFEFAEIFVIEKRLPDSASRAGDSPTQRVGELGFVFRLRISSRIRSQNRNGSKCSVRVLCRTDLCKNPRKSASLPCPYIYMQKVVPVSQGGLEQVRASSLSSPPPSPEMLPATTCHSHRKPPAIFTWFGYFLLTLQRELLHKYKNKSSATVHI
jgi:hypothetical protein